LFFLDPHCERITTSTNKNEEKKLTTAKHPSAGLAMELGDHGYTAAALRPQFQSRLENQT
jgi:hypothetical protein